MTDKLIELKNVSAGYEAIPVINHVNIVIREHDFIGVIGPNGGGKTTLLKTLLRIIKPLHGEVIYKHKELNIGYLPQISSIDNAFPISVQEVINSGLLSKNNKLLSWKKTKNAVYDIASSFGITELLKMPIGQLSGGQFQKVLLARSIISNPQLLILDEPDTFVDSVFEVEMYKTLQTLNQRMAIILVSHDVGMIAGQVKTIACVNKQVHYHPTSEISEELLQAYNCPVDIITHGKVPHRVLKTHSHD